MNPEDVMTSPVRIRIDQRPFYSGRAADREIPPAGAWWRHREGNGDYQEAKGAENRGFRVNPGAWQKLEAGPRVGSRLQIAGETGWELGSRLDQAGGLNRPDKASGGES